MKCPKCKNEVPKEAVFCPSCNLRLVIECPKCKSKVRLGSASCKNCGYVFVKFCPRCNSANYVSSPTCRKCFYTFDDIKDEPKEEIKETKAKEKPPQAIEPVWDGKLVVLVDFLNLNSIFEKFKDAEFKNKVLQNITTSIKVAFGASADFYRENTAIFKVVHNKNNSLYDKIQKFNGEMAKFNVFLNETLSCAISHKFVILKSNEIKKDKPIMQLIIGGDKDIVTTKAAYDILCNEISLVKISPDSYKMVNLEKEAQSASEIKETDQDLALETIFQAVVKENNIRGISVNAPRGTGKTYLLNALFQKFENSDVAILPARCSAMSQVAPMGLFQDAFLNLFNLPFAPNNYKQTTDDLKNLIKQYLPNNFDKEKIETLVNFLYPSKEAYYENLDKNKETTFLHIKDILDFLRQNSKLLLTIDDFDLIDEMSFEFLTYLIKNNFFTQGSKFLICYRNQNALNMYIPQEILPKENCLDISLKKREISSTRNFIKSKLGDLSVLPVKTSDQILMNARGDLAYTDQVLHHFIETKMIKLHQGKFVFSNEFEDYFVPQNMADIMAKRLQFLEEKSKTGFIILNLASFLGGKFTKTLIRSVIEMAESELDRILSCLTTDGYIIKIDEDLFVFKNSLVWTNIYIFAKNNPEMKPYIEALLKVLIGRTISSPAICALLAQMTGNKPVALALWTKNLKIASAIGDSALYIISQKQSLVNLEGVNLPSENYIRNNIYERLGKLTYKKSPAQAIEYLSNAVVEAKNQGSVKKIIELSGYLVKSCYLAQKYTAVVETVDNVCGLFKNKPKTEVQSALIKARKLDALLNTGNYEEVVNIVNTEINQLLPEIIKNKKKFTYVSKDEIYSTWLKANVILAEAYIYQGSPLAFELITLLEKEIFKDPKNIDEALAKRLNLTCALAYTAKGIFSQSDEILHTLIKDFSKSKEENFLISKWNMITLFNKVLRFDFDNIKEDLFEAVTFANNIGDNFTKNILKTILAYVILEEGDSLRALEICQEQMMYFSEEKIAIGALIAWYISACATLKTQGADRAITICEKSVQIAEGTKINTTWFKILFQILMSKCYIIKDDLESAKMYTELASQDVNQNELNYFLLQIVKLRAQILENSIDKVKEDKKAEVAESAVKTYEKAISLSDKLNLDKMSYKLRKDLTGLKATCKLKRIILPE